MALRTRLTALFIAGFAATMLVAADTPPKHLKLVGDHWTAWDPPSEFPEGTKVHIVVAGDTLWDLAAAHLGNPYLWPQIWEKNPYVLDAHWIYPGDPLAIGVEVVGADEAGALMADGSADGDGEHGDTAPAGGRGNVPVPLGAESDIYCSGFIDPSDESFGWSIVGSEYEAVMPPTAVLPTHSRSSRAGNFGQALTVKYTLSLGDVIYLDGGRNAGLSPGMVLEAVEVGREVRHPITRDKFGRLYETLGRVRVLSVQDDGAIAEIIQSCSDMRVGNRLRVFQPEPVPLARRTPLRPVNEPTWNDLTDAPVILGAPADIVSLGQDHVVYIDRGADDDVLPGDFFTVYRINPHGGPAVVLGELAVLTSRSHTAVAKILESRYPIYAGDRLERK